MYTLLLPCWLICNLLHCPVLRSFPGKQSWKPITPVDLLSNLNMINSTDHIAMYQVLTMKSLDTTCFKIAWGSKVVSHQYWFSALLTFNSPNATFTCLPDVNLIFLMNMWSIKNLGHIQIHNLVFHLTHQKWPKWPRFLGHPTQLQPCWKRRDTIIHAGIERWP